MGGIKDGIKVVNSIARAISILKCFNNKDLELTLGEISTRTGMSKSTVHRILQTLRADNFIEQNEEDDKYRLSFELIRLGVVAANTNDLRKIAIKEMEWLANRTKHGSNLYIIQGSQRLCYAQVEGAYYIKKYSEVGGLFPLYCGSGGKVLLAFKSDDWINNYLDNTVLERTALATPTTKEKVWESLNLIRKNGWTYTHNERNDGACSIAAPVRDYSGNVVASVTLSGPTTELPIEKININLPLLMEAAKRISNRLGNHN